MTKTSVTLPALLALAFVQPSTTIADQPVHDTFSGTYTVVNLNLDQGLRFTDNYKTHLPQTVHLAFRDDKLVNWWFIGHPWEAIHQHGSTTRLTKAAIRGTLNLRAYDVRGRHQLTAELSFDITRKADQFTGTFQAKLVGAIDKTWSGQATGETLAPIDSFASTAGWPNFSGPNGTLGTTDGPALIDDLRESKPLWRSETYVPVSYGNAADDRYPNRAAGCRYGGGSSSPVYADGIIYIAFYQPNFDIDPAPKKGYADKWWGDPLTKYAKEQNLIPEEIQAIKDHWRPIGDSVVVAMDAQTGRTLWRTTYPKRVYNLQTHKHRGTFGVPLIAAGKVFYPNFNNAIQAMDAKTGEPLWEFPKFEAPPKTRHRPAGPQSQSPLLFDKTLVWTVRDETYGLDADTGKIIWTNKLDRYRDYDLRSVTLNNKPFILAVAMHHGKSSIIRLIDPADGSTQWEQPTGGKIGCYEGHFANTVAVTDDKLIAYLSHTPPADPRTKRIDKAKVTHHINAWGLSPTGMNHLWEDKHLPPDEGPHIAIANGVVYGVGKHLVRCLDLGTGKVLGEITESEFPHPVDRPIGDPPRSNPLLIVAGDKLVLSPEGQHGKHGFILFDADPTKLTLFGDQARKWAPPHATTTAYGRQPIVNPIVDGRMIFRGGNGIYCYDLRMSVTSPE